MLLDIVIVIYYSVNITPETEQLKITNTCYPNFVSLGMSLGGSGSGFCMRFQSRFWPAAVAAVAGRHEMIPRWLTHTLGRISQFLAVD